jgi:large repetitive protein
MFCNLVRFIFVLEKRYDYCMSLFINTNSFMSSFSQTFTRILFLVFFLFPSLIYAQITLTKLVDKTTVQSGENFTYTIQYTCISLTGPFHNVKITDIIPSNVVAVAVTGSAHTVGTPTIVGPLGSQVVTFNFIDPMPSGSTGDVTITCRFPNGRTPNGATATSTATMTTSSQTVTSNPVTVTATATNKFCPDLAFSSGGAVGGETSYYIQIGAANRQYVAPAGVLNPENMTVVQRLPAGTTFVSAGNDARGSCCGHGYELPFVNANSIPYTYDSGTNTITWTIPAGYVAIAQSNSYPTGFESNIFLRSFVRYDNPPFAVNGTITSTVDITYTPLGTVTPLTLVGNSFSGNPCETNLYSSKVLQAPTFAALPIKYATNMPASNELPSGANIQYGMSWGNKGNMPLDNFTVIDDFPDYLRMTNIAIPGHANATGINWQIYYKSVDNPTYTLFPGGPYPASTFQGITIYNEPWSVSFNLAATDRLTGIKIEFGTVPGSFEAYTTYWSGKLLDVTANYTSSNCLSITSTTAGYTPVAPVCATITHTPRLTYAVPYPNKSFHTGEYNNLHYGSKPVGSVFWTHMEMETFASSPMVNPVIMDLLPLGMTYDGLWSMPSIYNTAGLGAPVFEHIINYNNSGRELLRWRWTGTYTTLDGRATISVRLKLTNKAIPGAGLQNMYALSADNVRGCRRRNIYDPSNDLLKDNFDIDGDGSTTDSLCFSNIQGGGDIQVDASAALESIKLVKGQLDANWTRYPDFGRTVQGGLADYKLKVTNVGNIPMKDMVVLDILPFIGDVGVLDPQTRLTQWRPNLAGPVTAPLGVTVYYSTASNPCRTELNYSPAGCTAANWSLTPPADITDVQALKFDFGSIILQPGDSLLLNWPMRAPVNAPVNNEIAWNSFGYKGVRTDNSIALLSSEPIKVGIKVTDPDPAIYGDRVWLDTDQDGIQDVGELGVAGVHIDLYRDNGDGVSNPNTDTYINFTVTDNDGRYLFPNLPPGNYFAKFLPPVGYAVSPSNAGNDDALDSDGVLAPVTNLVATEDDRTWDLGIYPSSACDIEIASYTVGNCVYNTTTNRSEATVTTIVSWVNPPVGQTINVTMTGATTQSINPATATSPQLLTFIIPADALDHTLAAAFTSGCGGIMPSRTFTAPVPCVPNVCALAITDVNTSACIASGASSYALVDVTVAWSNAPMGENITVTAGGVSQTINVATGTISPVMVTLQVPTNGTSGNVINAVFTGIGSTCNDTDTYNSPASCVCAPACIPITVQKTK